jgi:hypothetical protein
MKQLTFLVMLTAIGVSIGLNTADSYSQESKLNVDDFISNWSNATGIIVTRSARQTLTEVLAAELGSRAVKLGLNTSDVTRLRKAFVMNRTVEVSGFGNTGKISSGDVSVSLSRSDQITELNASFSTLSLIKPLRELATIRILVTPIPPRDYRVRINNENLEPTEYSKYAVAAGDVQVLVTRTGKPDCAWQQTVPKGAEREISCSL